MPKVNIDRDLLFKALNKVYTETEFEDLCFAYGIELDEVTSEKMMIFRETGVDDPNASDDVLYKIDVPANRYDLLCLEGIARALNVYNLVKTTPQYVITPPPNGKTHEKLYVSKEVSSVRPIIVSGILRNITFNEDTYQSFIDLQEKLHQNICRKRTLVSIGTHDLDTLKGPFYYKALPPKDIKFVPLSQTKEYDAVELFDFYDKSNSHLKKYLPIIKDSPLYPGVFDSNNVLCSLPPIINGNHSKITLNTKNVFIEITATDRTKANVVLNIMLTMFSEYCKEPFTMEQVEVIEADGTSQLYPQIEPKYISATVDYINKSVGLDLNGESMVNLLKRMSLDSKLIDDGKSVVVAVPPTRSDIIHACDIMEDVAIGYGFNNLVKEIPKVHTTGRIQPLNKISELLAQEVAMAGFTEIMTFVLCQNKDNFEFLNRQDDNSSVKIGNYLHIDFSEIRTNLISTLMKSVVTNKSAPLPLKLFEISDVSVKGSTGNKDLSDPNSNNSDVGSYNKRMLGAIYCNVSSKLEIMHGLLDRIMLVLNIPSRLTKENGYYLQVSEDKLFVPRMGTDIMWNGKKIGIMGVAHPDVLKNYGCPFPCSILELEINSDLLKNLN
eukprot:gene2918-3636_t